MELINTIAQVVMALTAVIMAYLAYMTYLKSPDQEDEPDDASLTPELENDSKLLSQVVFVTSKQETTLKVTNQGLECHLKDTRPDRGGLQWIIRPNEASIILQNSNFYVNPGFRSRTGRFNIGIRRNWLYSKNLFPEPDYLKSVIKELLVNAISYNKV
ncbi:hypothetical protein [Flagellimonas sp. CMM7]|uniref:hypothetical protein n=1 Tax=Flagellimonas sp. CMM7 TaxID=2654676 RepID=UPI0013D729BE|nr:hypothetical protein [Flagellimonas sp. CMM7]UII81069.1 hypothetical protein LV704_06025 [Flagellimonas sp. CMM7]